MFEGSRNLINNFDDEKLIALIIEGYKPAEEELFRRNMKELYGSVEYYCKDINEADDLIQDSVIAALEQIRNREFEYQGIPIIAYLKGICKNHYRKYLRDGKYRSFITTSDTYLDYFVSIDEDDQMEIESLECERNKIVKRVFDQLDPICEQLLIYYYYNDLRPRHIIMLMPEFSTTQAISSRKHKCLTKIKRKIEKLQKN